MSEDRREVGMKGGGGGGGEGGGRGKEGVWKTALRISE